MVWHIEGGKIYSDREWAERQPTCLMVLIGVVVLGVGFWFFILRPEWAKDENAKKNLADMRAAEMQGEKDGSVGVYDTKLATSPDDGVRNSYHNGFADGLKWNTVKVLRWDNDQEQAGVITVIDALQGRYTLRFANGVEREVRHNDLFQDGKATIIRPVPGTLLSEIRKRIRAEGGMTEQQVVSLLGDPPLGKGSTVDSQGQRVSNSLQSQDFGEEVPVHQTADHLASDTILDGMMFQ